VRVKLQIKGDRRLRANLARMKQFKKSEINPLMATALEPLRETTESNARVLRNPGNPRGGHLDQGVVAAPVPTVSAATRTTWWVSFARRARKIAHLVEFGTAPHAQPRRGIMHPGARPKPFFRPAFDSTKGEIFGSLSQGIKRLLLSKVR